MKRTAFEIIANQDLSGKVFLITGGYSGLGAIHAEALLMANATVIVAGRNEQLQLDFQNRLKSKPNLNFEDHQLDVSKNIDLGDLQSVQEFAIYIKKKYTQIDCLINNAGVMFTPPGKTKDGFEMQMGVNVIGHFLLAKILVDITKRQVWLSSKGHIRFGAPRIDLKAITDVDENNYVTRARYQQSKLGDILLAKQFAQKHPHLKAVSVHPGVVKTNLGRHMTMGKKILFVLQHPIALMNMLEPEEGAATQVMLSIQSETDLVNGAYHADCKVIEEAESARNMDDAKLLYDYCDEVTKAFQV
ncbi:hypothetical protein BFP97_02055 [Roseivirga sp. 4D4]|uniref:SDR family NAD(P)-dependent oxidoreductase n=1 Tax=Roseivirga sp. 4D4 TaxID=1889784 RepID=UPI0008538721|nr:SDR family NAD(P)-dependent oxidoreductase [Roseivirga sp. 4D4]OEK00369.1 hypothetical protein BFP97_02055 [Roseivirga sp. 4D4]